MPAHTGINPGRTSRQASSMSRPKGGIIGRPAAIGKIGKTDPMTIEIHGTLLASSGECERLIRLP